MRASHAKRSAPATRRARERVGESEGRSPSDEKEGDMIARVWRGYARPEHADAYEALLKPELLPGLSKVEGYRESYLLRRQVGDEVEFVTIILWDSIEHVCAIAGPDYETAVIPEERRKYLSRFDSKAVHYEVASTHRRS